MKLHARIESKRYGGREREKGIKGGDFSFVRNYIAFSLDENISFVKYECFKRKEEKDVRSFLMESFLVAKLDL